MTQESQDRRVLRTKELLKNALLALIKEKGFEALTVQDILDRANVGRSTFYTHFQGKEDLLIQGLDKLRAFLRDEQRRCLAAPSGDRETKAFSFREFLFAHVHEQRGVFRAMVGKNSGLIMQRHFQQTLNELVRDDVYALVPSRGAKDPHRESMIPFIAGGLYGLLAGWMDGQIRMTVEEMSDQFQQFALSVVRLRLPHSK